MRFFLFFSVFFGLRQIRNDDFKVGWRAFTISWLLMTNYFKCKSAPIFHRSSLTLNAFIIRWIVFWVGIRSCCMHWSKTRPRLRSRRVVDDSNEAATRDTKWEWPCRAANRPEVLATSNVRRTQTRHKLWTAERQSRTSRMFASRESNANRTKWSHPTLWPDLRRIRRRFDRRLIPIRSRPILLPGPFRSNSLVH